MALDYQRGTRHLAVGVVFISALVMGYILYELGETKKNFAFQLIEQSSDRVQSELDEFFLPARNILLTLKQQQEMQFFRQPDPSSFNSYLIPIIKQYPQISSIGIADSRGYEFNVLPDTTNGQWLNREVFVDQWGMTERWKSFSLQDNLVTLQTWTQPLETDPRNRPWFLGAKQAEGKHVHWTEPYVYMTGELGLTASILGKEHQGSKLRHILALDITLTDITRFSQGLDLTTNNQVFVLTKSKKSIIGLPEDYENLSTSELQEKFLSSPEEFGNQPLIDLLEYPNDEIVSFQSDGKQWWGVEKTYSITPEQQLSIAILVPEHDFSSEIDSTRNAMIAGFLVILSLSSMLVLNHNKLRNLSLKLNKNNATITEQKERLFVEVHHRVKNNLAVMVAFIELENMALDEKAENEILVQIQRRIKSMAAVHEVLYKADDMNKVPVNDFTPDILKFSEKDFVRNNIHVEQSIGPVLINVNQALTFGLLINEYMNSIIQAGANLVKNIVIRINKSGTSLIAEIKTDADIDFIQNHAGVGKQLIKVLLSQLEAELDVQIEKNDTRYIISFELQDKKGITSNLNY